MKNYFYAYHGPINEEDFDFKRGYGITEKSKSKKISIGDGVYVIQKIKGNDYFQFCGLFEVIDKYEEFTNSFPYRMELSNLTELVPYPRINEDEIGSLLPNKEGGDKNWSNFKKYFCQQGATFQSPLNSVVINILNDLIPKKSPFPPIYKETSLIELIEKLDNDVKKSLQLTPSERKNRLEKSAKKPSQSKVTITVFNRNPDVVAEVLLRSQGKCEQCKCNAPFTKKTNGMPYLEVHHIIQLSIGGDDSVENAVALCPNCHRQNHYGI
jgi:5-methylcytosine-specific restriction protein A